MSAGPRASAAPAAPSLRLEPDLLKGVGILVVVLIHSMRSGFSPGVSEVELWLGQVTRFAVPGFLLASGFLYFTPGGIAGAVTLRRVRRVAVPYLVASGIAQGTRIIAGDAPVPREVLSDLVFASSFGPYYYVWVALVMVLVAPLLARLGARARWVLLALALALQFGFETLRIEPLPFFWHLRNPLLWLAYFVAGWQLRAHGAALQGGFERRRSAFVAAGAAVFLACGAWIASDLPDLAWRSVPWLGVWAALGGLLALSLGRPSTSRGLRALSDASYPIYLYHVFFIDLAHRLVVPKPGVFDPLALLAPWAAGLAGSFAVLWLGRRVLGERSRLWLGA